jgi:acyl carrier protein
MIDDTLGRTRAILERIAGPQRTPGAVTPHTRLGDGFWLDSVELLEVVIACEQEFGIVFSESGDLDASHLDTFGSLVDLVVRRRQELIDRP